MELTGQEKIRKSKIVFLIGASLKSQAFTEHPKTQHDLEHIANMVTPN